MFLNFKCPACENQIQAEYQNIGEWVECPVCSFVQVVPDPPLPPGSTYNGYVVEGLTDASLLWLTYKAKGDQEMPGRDLILKTPTSFFLKNVSDFDAFANAAISGGSLNIDGIARLLDKSLVHGKFHFVYDSGADSQLLSAASGVLRPADAVVMARTISSAMDKAWEKLGSPHMNISPQTIALSPSLDVQIFDMGLSKYLLADSKLLSMGFNIWDLRYASPEARAGTQDFSSPVSDIYSLGALLHFVLSGRHPFEDEEFDQRTPFPELPGGIVLPEPFRDLIKRMTAFSPAQRPSSWKSLLQELDAVSGFAATHDVSNPEGRKTVRRFLSQPAKPDGRNAGPVGLTHTNIKIDKKLKLQVPKRKPQVSETIAKLFPVSSHQRAAHGRGSRQSSEGKADSALKILIVVAVILAVVSVPVAFYFIFKKDTPPFTPPPVAAPAAEQSAPGEPSPAAPQGGATVANNVPSAKAAPGKPRLMALLREADTFWTANPDSFDEALKKYEEAAAYSFEIKDFSLMDSTRDKVNEVMDKRNSKVAAIIKQLDALAEPLVSAGNFEGASKIYLDYKGPLERESLQKRELSSASVKKQGVKNLVDAKTSELQDSARKLASQGRYNMALELLDSYSDEFAAETAPARKALAAELKKEKGVVTGAAAPALKKSIPNLCRLDAEKALAELKEAAKDPSAAPAAAQLEFISSDIERFISLNPSFVEEMKGSVGKGVQLALSGRKPEDFSVIEARQDSVSVKSADGKVSDLKFKDLALEAQISFAAKHFKVDDCPLLCLLIGIQSNDRAYVKEIVSKLPLSLDALVVSELKEIDAKDEFERMLDSCSMPYDKSDYATFIPQMLKKEFPPATATKLLSLLDDFKRKYASARFIDKNKGLLENIERNCRRAGAVIPQRIVVDNDFLKKNNLSLSDVIEKAQPSTTIELKKGSYPIQGNAPLSAFKTGLRIIGEEGVEIDSGIKVMADKVSISNILCKKGRLEIVSANDVRVENCHFFSPGSAIRSSSKLVLDNCLLKGLLLSGSKDVEINHCTVVGTAPVDDKINTAILFMGDELAVTNSVLYGDAYAIVLSAKAEKRKIALSNCLVYGESGAAAELNENGTVGKNIAKNESSFKRYVKSTKNTISPIQFAAPNEGNYSLIKDTPGSSSSADGKDCGVVWKSIPVVHDAKDRKK